MSQACEDFLRGQGRLAGLLWELPPYEPPASLEANFLAAARAAQETVGAANGREFAAIGRSYEHQPAFEAPAQLAARFSQLAAELDAAQASRRDAVLAQIAAGETPQAVLGAPVQPATAAWLKAQATPKPATKPQKPPHKVVWWGFSWFDLRLAALATILAAVGTQWLLQHAPTSAELALLEAFQNENKTLAEAQPAPPQNPVGAAPEPAPALARTSAAASKTESSQSSAGETIAPSALRAAPRDHGTHASTAPEETPVLAAAPAKPAIDPLELKREHSLNDTAAPTARAAQLARKSMIPPDSRTDESPLATMREAAAPAAAEKITAAPAPAAAPMPAAPARPALSVAASPAPAAAPARPAVMAASAPLSAENQARIRSPGRSLNARLSDDPASFAPLLPARPAGAVWQVFSSIADDAAARRWLEALRQSMPAETRPARFELVHEAGSSEPGWLRIQPPSTEAKTR